MVQPKREKEMFVVLYTAFFFF